jgi:hypothetical protein
MRRVLLAVLAATASILLLPATSVEAEVSGCAAETYRPAEQSPFGGEPAPPLRAIGPGREAPPEYRLDRAEVISIAVAADAAREEVDADGDAAIRVFTQGPCRWQVSLYREGEEVARVAIDDGTGTVLEAWRDHQVGTELARGYEGAVAQAVNSPWVWLPLCVLFVLPFFDRRRPWRALHLDLAVILGLSVSLLFFNRAEIEASVLLTYPVVGYVLARMLWLGFRPREGAGPLVPVAPIRWLAAGAVLLACARIALNLADSQVIDIGVAGVIGADRIGAGEPLYEGAFSPGLDLRGDVYGPFNYLSYLPFEVVFPYDGWNSVPASHAAAIAFDLLTALGLLFLGRRLRPGSEGRALGIALSFAWLACPFTLYAMNANANDSLIAALLVGALLAISSAAGRGIVTALAAAAKFGPAALAPLFAAGTGERRLRSMVVFSIAFALVAVVLTVPFLPDGGLREFYDRTLGYQAARSSPFSIWGLAPSLDWLQTVVRLGAVALAVAVAFVPARRSPAQVAALAAAVTVAVQLGAAHWFYFYVVWFLPAYLVACFMVPRRVTADGSGQA